MVYTEEEIVSSYLRSGRRKSQIRILAELNAEGQCDEDVNEAYHRITAILRKRGVLKESKSERAKGFRVMSGYVADCMSAAESHPRQAAAYRREIQGVREHMFGGKNVKEHIS